MTNRKKINPRTADQFDRLPEAIVLLIFEKIIDAKTLITCLCVSKRFSSFVPESKSVFLKIPQFKFNTSENDEQKEDENQRESRRFLKYVVDTAIPKTEYFLRRLLHHPSPAERESFEIPDYANVQEDGTSYPSPRDFLKNFRELRFLEIELPCQAIELRSGIGGEPLVRWRANFSRSLVSFVILISEACSKMLAGNEKKEPDEKSECFFSFSQLMLETNLAMSCLFESYARHHLIKYVLLEKPMLCDIVVTDGYKRGKLCMSKENLDGLRSLETVKDENWHVKAWHESLLELPLSGYIMEGATLILMGAIEPGMAESVVMGAFEEEEKVVVEAARKLMKRERVRHV
ncbi:F-box protein [Actinidia chinensis var. chinensis]|uniref:F-box protein n=1 Tax=Actinidia chinensis var. chinensis TaxID=1590841 RepID=A0A2R6P814_ACTCC|nr:F-box protein [Actinidia chinensis var. chinensis]